MTPLNINKMELGNAAATSKHDLLNWGEDTSRERMLEQKYIKRKKSSLLLVKFDVK